MQWRHTCDLEWMKARQQYMTASDVIKLLPITKTGRKRNVSQMDMLSVYAGKKIRLLPSDTVSTGAAARGHILESYAVKAMNKTDDTFYHWDDKIVADPASKDRFPLAFSPDACNVPMPGPWTIIRPNHEGLTKITEIKSYGVEKHMSKLLTDACDIEERWQVAVAMAVSDQIEEANICFFNPSLGEFQTIIFGYDRNSLKNEIEIVKEVHENFNDFVESFCRRSSLQPDVIIGGEATLEEAIIKTIQSEVNINPC